MLYIILGNDKMVSEMYPQNAHLKVSIVVTVGLFYQN